LKEIIDEDRDKLICDSEEEKCPSGGGKSYFTPSSSFTESDTPRGGDDTPRDER
jgi:hypothetical protein